MLAASAASERKTHGMAQFGMGEFGMGGAKADAMQFLFAVISQQRVTNESGAAAPSYTAASRAFFLLADGEMWRGMRECGMHARRRRRRRRVMPARKPATAHLRFDGAVFGTARTSAPAPAVATAGGSLLLPPSSSRQVFLGASTHNPFLWLKPGPAEEASESPSGQAVVASSSITVTYINYSSEVEFASTQYATRRNYQPRNNLLGALSVRP